MSALAFDTYKAVTALKQAGFAEPQAEAVVTRHAWFTPASGRFYPKQAQQRYRTAESI